MGKSEESVLVVVRCRPLNANEVEKELEASGNEEGRDISGCVRMASNLGLVEIRKPGLSTTDPPKGFTFDAIYDWNSKQDELYEETFATLVNSVLNGFNGTIFAYGQTGTGKTYTMEGSKDKPGVIPRAFEHIFRHISDANKDEQYLVRSSYLEIYQEEVRDLLSKNHATKRLELKERPDTGVYVKDLSPFVCKSQSEIERVMKVGNQNRSVGATKMNEHSSRSHAIFMITVECARPDPEKNGEPHIRVGKLNLVDLAGSERQAKTGATGDRLKEATKINLSLSALGNVISALVDGKSAHIPYRDSKLTRLLQDSLGGNAKTVMVANIGPAAYNYEESLTTLRYANRAKNIKNKPKINEDPKDAMLREYQEEIARLKSQLSTRKTDKRGKSAKRRKSAKRNSTIVSDDMLSGENNDSNKLMESSDTSTLSVPMDTSTEMESPEDQANNAEEQYQLDNINKAADEMEHRLLVERELLEADTGMLDNEKEKLLSDLSAKENALKSQREDREKVVSKIQALESQLLSGTGMGGTKNNTPGVGSGSSNNIVEHTNEQQKILEKRKADLAERKKLERNAAQELEAKEEQGEELEKTYTSLQQEAETKTRKLRKLFTKLQSVKQDIVDVTEEYNRDRRDLEDTQQQLLKELKLKIMLIENFIPPNDRKKLLARAAYDEEEDTWYMTRHRNEAGGDVNGDKGDAVAQYGVIMKRPVSAAGSRRPVSEYAKMISGLQHSGAAGARYRGENIMRLSLDRGGRTTREYEGPDVAPRVQAALDAAMLNVEPDIEVDVTALSSKTAVRGMRKSSQGGLSNSSSKSNTKNNNRLSGKPAAAYPASRGLVPK